MNNQYGSLSGKKVILLGGTSGLGLATAKAAAAEGANVILVSSNLQRVQEVLKELPEGSEGYAVDLGLEENIKNFFERIGNFDHLVYTAGENIHLATLKDTEIEYARKYWNLRYWGAVTAVKYATPYLNAGGSINLTGGTASRRPGSGWSLGSSICAAMEGFMRTMAVELAPLRVNMIAPGMIKTELWGAIPEADRQAMYNTVGNQLLLKRIGDAEDVAQAFLYTMKQKFGTGQIIFVDGGTLLV
ncbi:SDR family oxidoreductase [Pedobacter sp. L105]|uniref:SDR family oxidoreductase n=1 Tax=Pedobacter sp. L105 TaxID=1641871 RepID=UPI00131B6B19|nr:SDR family oxidoreductase [Pedobacter sp. L105]